MNTTFTQCPPDGHGRRRWKWKTACLLHKRGVPIHIAYKIISAEMRRTGPENRDDTERTLRRIYGNHLPISKRHRAPYPRIQLHSDPDSLRRFFASNEGLRPVNPLAFVNMVLEGAPFVCFGPNPRRTHTIPLSSVTEQMLAGATAIVPNPLSGCLGTNKSGMRSNRCESLVTERRFQIVEFDDLNIFDQCARILHLRDTFGVPLVAVIFSGRASLHAWFKVRHLPAEHQKQFADYAAESLGADPSFHSPVQLTRMPFATRPETSAVQQLILFNNRALFQ